MQCFKFVLSQLLNVVTITYNLCPLLNFKQLLALSLCKIQSNFGSFFCKRFCHFYKFILLSSCKLFPQSRIGYLNLLLDFYQKCIHYLNRVIQLLQTLLIKLILILLQLHKFFVRKLARHKRYCCDLTHLSLNISLESL